MCNVTHVKENGEAALHVRPDLPDVQAVVFMGIQKCPVFQDFLDLSTHLLSSIPRVTAEQFLSVAM